MDIEKIEKKYAGILSYTQVSGSDNHVYFREIVKKIKRSGANGSSLGILEKIGDYYAELAPVVRDSEIEKRWKPNRRSELPNHSSKYAQQDKDRRKEDLARGRRESDQRREAHESKGQDYLRHDGKEEFFASLIYSMTSPKKSKEFARTFFNSKDMTNLKLVGSYYTGQFSGNNTLFETLLLADESGKKVAPQIASTIEKIVGDKVMSKAVYDLRSLVGEAARMYYMANKADFVSFMGRLKRQNPELYHEAEIEDPRTLMLYSGNPQSGTTFVERLEGLKTEANIIIGTLDRNGKPIKPIPKSLAQAKIKTSRSTADLDEEERALKTSR